MVDTCNILLAFAVVYSMVWTKQHPAFISDLACVPPGGVAYVVPADNSVAGVRGVYETIQQNSWSDKIFPLSNYFSNISSFLGFVFGLIVYIWIY